MYYNSSPSHLSLAGDGPLVLLRHRVGVPRRRKKHGQSPKKLPGTLNYSRGVGGAGRGDDVEVLAPEHDAHVRVRDEHLRHGHHVRDHSEHYVVTAK